MRLHYNPCASHQSRRYIVDHRGTATGGSGSSRNRPARTRARIGAFSPHHSEDGGQRRRHPGNGGFAGEIDQRARGSGRRADRRGRGQHAWRARPAAPSSRLAPSRPQLGAIATTKLRGPRIGGLSPAAGLNALSAKSPRNCSAAGLPEHRVAAHEPSGRRGMGGHHCMLYRRAACGHKRPRSGPELPRRFSLWKYIERRRPRPAGTALLRTLSESRFGRAVQELQKRLSHRLVRTPVTRQRH